MSHDPQRAVLPALPADEATFIDDILTEWSATPASRDVARYTMVGFGRWLASRGTSLAEATRADCREWLDLRASQVAPKTLARNWSDLRAFYRTAEADFADPLDGRRSPMAGIKMPRIPKYAKTHAATVAEVDAVMAVFDRRTALGLRNAAMISLMFRSGLRVSEVAAANLDELDLEARTIHLPMTKNEEPRTPPLHPETLTLLRRWLRRRGDRPGPLFVAIGPRSRGDRVTVSAIQNVLKRAAAKANVPVTPHTLRRGYVVEYLTHGGDTATLMVNGGWESETMIVRYMADSRSKTAQVVYDDVARRQVAARKRLRVVS